MSSLPPSDTPAEAPYAAPYPGPTPAPIRRIVPHLLDPWRPSHPIPLDRWAEREHFPPVLMAVVGLVIGLVGFQLLGTAVGLALVVVQGGLDDFTVEMILTEYLQEQLIGNSVGQFVVLLGGGVLLARLHTSRPKGYLRLRRGDMGLIALATVGLWTLMPFVWWLGSINEGVPLPEGWREFFESQAELSQGVLTSQLSLPFVLFALAITPAICEEVFFRGYVQRNFERSFGPAVGIILTGTIFGMYHLNLLQVVPLSVLGIYMGYVVWRTGSLWAGVAAHFANNGTAVILERVISSGNTEAAEAAELVETSGIPWWLVLLSIGLSGVVIWALHVGGAMKLAEVPPPEPDEDVPPALPDVGPVA